MLAGHVRFAGSVGILPWLELGLVLPATVSQSGQVASMVSSALADFTPSGGLGDPRLVPRAHVLGVGDFDFAVLVPFTLPLGSTQDYIGWGSVTATPTVAAEWSGLKGLRLAANAGVAIRPQRTIGDLTVGSAFAYGAAGSYDFPIAFLNFTAMLTATGEVGIGGSSGATDPAEMLAALRWNAPLGISAALAGGPGLSNGYGTPNYRVVFMAGFALPSGESRREK